MRQKLAVALKLMWRHPRLSIAFWAAAAIRGYLYSVFIWLIKTFLDSVIKASELSDPSELTRTLLGVGALIFCCWVARSVADYFATVLQTDLGRRVEVNLRLNLVQHLLRLSLSFFDRHSRGDIMRAASGDAAALRMLVYTTCGMGISTLQGVSLLVMAFQFDFTLALWGLAALPIVAFPLIRAGAKILEQARAQRAEGVSIANLLLQILSGIRIVKIFEGEEREAKACNESAAKLMKAAMAIVKRQSVAGVILDGLGGLGLFLVIMIAGPRIAAGKVEWSTFAGFLLLLVSMFGVFRKVLSGYAAIKEQSIAIERTEEFLACEPEIIDGDDAVSLKAPPKEICFQNVSYAYDEEPVLRDVNLTIRAGETIGVVGPSGVGKTTLLNLAARFYDPDRGRLLFDGLDIRRVKLKDLMKCLAIVTQEPFLFHVSVLENIRYGRPEATPHMVHEAAKAAKIHDDIVSWPEGYDTIIGPRGTGVSVGQKQRINIARAILKNAPILLLDEATSALDSATEVQVQEALDALMKKCTTLVVAHRLSTLRGADRIAVLSNGTIEAFAPHEELLETSPTYQRLWKAQQRPTAQATADESDSP